MDPITAIAIAGTAFNAIKKGIQIGNDIESMSSDISRWMGAIGTIKQAEEKARNPPLFKSLFSRDSVEQEAESAEKQIENQGLNKSDLELILKLGGPLNRKEVLKVAENSEFFTILEKHLPYDKTYFDNQVFLCACSLLLLMCSKLR